MEGASRSTERVEVVPDWFSKSREKKDEFTMSAEEYMTDDVVNQRGDYLSLKSISLMMITSRLLGTLLAQLLFIPGATYVAWFTKFMN